MAHEVDEEQNGPSHGTAHELSSKYSPEDPEKINAKRERFLALLKSRYGYTNDKAVDELERLLRLFYRSNKSLNIHLARTAIKIQARPLRAGKALPRQASGRTDPNFGKNNQ